MHCATTSKYFLKIPENLYSSNIVLPRLQKKKPVDFDDELKIGDVRYDNMAKRTIEVQLF